MSEECNSILVVVDRLTKQAVFIPTNTGLTAETLANVRYKGSAPYPISKLLFGVVVESSMVTAPNPWSHISKIGGSIPWSGGIDP